MSEQPVHRQPHALRWVWLLNLLVLLPVLPMAWGGRIPIQHDIFISDLLHSQLPYKAFLGRALGQGRLPLWMPDVFSGIPFLASIEAAPLFPPHALLYGLLDPYTALGVSLSLEIVVAALGAWCLARKLGAGPIPALVAGVAFAWSGFMVSHARHLNMHASAAILPWLVLALEHLLASAGRRGGLLLAGMLALMVLAGHPQILYIACLLLGARWLAHLPRHDWRAAWRAAWPARLREGAVFVSASGLGLMLAAVQLVPTWAYTQQSLGQVEPTWEYAAAFPCPPRDLLALVWPPLVGAMETWDYASQHASTIAWGNYGYGGLVTLILVVPALVLGAQRRHVWFWAGALALSLLLVLGPHTPLYRAAWALLPGMKLFRFPTRFLVVTALALAMLGALGLEAVMARLRPRLAPRALLGIGLTVVLLGLLDLQHHQLVRLPTDDVSAWRGAGGPRGITDGPEAGRVMVLGEFDIWETAFRRAQGHTLEPEPYRVAWTLPLGGSGVLNGLRSPSGYSRMVHWRNAAQWQEYNRDILPHHVRPRRPTLPDPRVGPAFQAQLDRGGVSWLLSPFTLEGGRLDPAGQAALLLYHNPTALPRAYLSQGWQTAVDYEAAMDWLMAGGAVDSSVPIIEGAPSPPPDHQGDPLPVEVEEQGPNRLSLRLPHDHPGGMLVIGDAWDSGWRAWVDDHPTPVLVANTYQRAVQVSASARVVAMRYEPPGLGLGLALSLVALALLTAWGVLAHRRRRSTGSGGG